ncbi:phage tail tape measure protein [uncultured Haemophilus sp.]|uniref:phage tail tape measure protein n=1 Tax=uncultured Haemophilus sp. TaxID=237779 RepID=UPI002628AD25|nr:phage tail tape measure protein [uncultured Haemophilus sp.]
MTDFATLGIQITSSGADKANNDIKSVGNNAKYTEQAIQSFMGTMGKLRALMAAGLGVQGFNQIVQMADKMNTLNAQVKLVSKSTQEFTTAQRKLFEISQNTRGSLEATTTLYVRSSRALKDFGYSQQRVLNFTETLNKAMAVGGVGAQEQASALFQLSQALGSGRLQGDEFRTIAEAAPIILDTIAEYMGKSRAEIKALGSEGKITSEIIFKAMETASGKIAKEFEGMPLTFGQAMQQMENSTMKFVDEFAKTTGAFSGAAEIVSFLAKNFDTLSVVIGGVLVGQLAKYTASMATAAITTSRQAIASQGLAGVLKNGLGGALSLLGGPAGVITIAASALFYFSQQAEQARAKSMDLEGANRLLEKSYKDLTLSSLGVEFSKQIKELQEQRKEIQRFKAQIATNEWEIDNNSGNPLFNSDKIKAEIAELKRQLNAALEVEGVRSSALNNLLTEFANKALLSGKSLKEFRGEMLLAGVSADQLNNALSPLNTDLLSITGEFQRLFPNIDTSKISIDGLNVSIGGFNVIAPSAETGAIKIASGISKIAAVAAIASGNLDVLKKTLPNANGGISEKGQSIINGLKLDKQIRETKDPAERARLQAQKSLENYKDKVPESDLSAIQSALYDDYLSQNTVKGRKGGGVDYVKQYTEQLSRMQEQLAQIKANSQDLDVFGGVSQYQEVNKLTQDIAANADKYAHYGAEGIANLKRLAGEIDSANQQFNIKQFGVTNSDKIKELEFQLQLMGKTRQEQEQLQFNHQLEQEAARLKIGMSKGNIALLDEEIAKIKQLHEEYQANAEKMKSDPMAGIRDGFNRFGQDAENIMGNVSNITLKAFDGMSGALTDLVMTGKADFGSLAKSIIKDIIQMTIKMMIFKAVSSMFGGKSDGGTVGSIDERYVGGLVGFDEGGFTGIGGKYQPAGLVHKGEYVMTKEATSLLGVDFLNYLNYQTKAKPKGFSVGGAVGGGSSYAAPLMTSNQPSNIKVNVINNGAPTQAEVESKQTGDGLEITIKLIDQIADERYSKNIQRDFGRNGGAYYRG